MHTCLCVRETERECACMSVCVWERETVLMDIERGKVSVSAHIFLWERKRKC